MSGDPQPDAIERLSAAVAAITPCSCSAQRARADEWAAKWKERGVLLHEMRKALAAAEAESAYHLSLLDGETALALVKARAEVSR